MVIAKNFIITEYAKPFVKWAGGKGQLLNTLERYYPLKLLQGEIKRYIEPFVGGGAVLFNILQKYNIAEAYIFDINVDLINAYKVIKFEVNELVYYLKSLEKRYYNLDNDNRKKMYYEIRDEYNSKVSNTKHIGIERASQFIFLNRTCFNGLYRVNKEGKFNVPYGDYKNPTICDERNLYLVSSLLQKVQIFAGDYRESAKYISKDSFVYFDPPYRPLNKTSNFTSYSKSDFTDKDQIELARFYAQMNELGAFLLLSNSDPKNEDPNDNFFDDLYKNFNIYRVMARRSINSDGRGRGLIKELLITNYKVE